MATRAKKGREAIDLGKVPPEVIAGARLVLAGAKVLPASEQAGCSRHAISRLLAKPGAAAAIKAHDDGKGTAATTDGPRARVRGAIPGPLEAQRDLTASDAQARREEVYDDARRRVPRDETCRRLGIGLSTYYELLKEAREAAAKAFRESAGDRVAELAEVYEQVAALAFTTAVAALEPPVLPDGLVESVDPAMLLPDRKGAAALLAVALKATQHLATLAGCDAPKGELPNDAAAKRMADVVAAISARHARQAATPPTEA